MTLASSDSTWECCFFGFLTCNLGCLSSIMNSASFYSLNIGKENTRGQSLCLIIPFTQCKSMQKSVSGQIICTMMIAPEGWLQSQHHVLLYTHELVYFCIPENILLPLPQSWSNCCNVLGQHGSCSKRQRLCTSS